MRSKPNLTGICLASLLLSLATAASADDLADKGRDIFKKNQSAVVTVQIVLKVTASQPGSASRQGEGKVETTGTVVDPSGLTVLALSSFDPSSINETLAGGADAASRSKTETEVSDMKILLGDGTELPSEVVLRDKDQDLAFIRPKVKPAAPLAALDLTKSARVQVLDEVITLNRLGPVAGRNYAASVERISGVVQKPRLFFVPDSTMTSTTLGSPAFALDGNVVGLFVLRAVSRSSSGTSNSRDFVAPIILPADDILRAAKQAPEAKAESKDETKDAAKGDAKEEKK